MPRGGFQMCSFEPRRYSICQIFSDLSKNKSKVKEKNPHICWIWHVSCTPFHLSLLGFRSWTCPRFQLPKPTTQSWKGKCNHHSNPTKPALLQIIVWLQISCSPEKLAVCRDSRGNKCRDGDEGGRKSRWAWEQDTCLSMLTISSFILDSDGWKQWR